MKRMTTDQAINHLAERWADDGMCIGKEYYVRKLKQLTTLAIRNECVEAQRLLRRSKEIDKALREAMRIRYLH